MAKRRAEGLLPVPNPGKGARVAGLAGWKVLAARMEPGEFYAFADLCALLPEYPRGSVKAYFAQRMPQNGVLSRVHAPEAGSQADVARLKLLADWRCDSGGGEGREGFARQAVDSVWLYTLSEHGEREAVAWRAILADRERE